MSLIWYGGEDIDFPFGTTITVSTTAGTFRAGYARCSLVAAAGATVSTRSVTFASPLTSAWLSFRLLTNTSSSITNSRGLGFGLAGTSKGLFVGASSSAGSKVSLWKYDGSSASELATESGDSLAVNTAYRVDLQVSNYGASATVNVYLNSALVITFTGNVAVSGMTAFDCVAFSGGNVVRWIGNISEVIVADEDTRPMLGLLTMAPNNTGTTDDWTGTGASGAPVNPTTINDANSVYTNTGAKDEQFNLINEPAGTFAVRAVRVAARAWITVGATANHLKLGFNSGGSVAVGTSQAVGTGATTYEQMWDTNPVTSAAWGDATEINALQIDLQSGT